MRVILFISLLVLGPNLIGNQLYAQSEGFGGWYQYFGNHGLASNWRLHNEVQFRDKQIEGKHEQLLLRLGLLYRKSSKLSYGAGYGLVYNYLENSKWTEPDNNENRFWQQLVGITPLSIIRFEHRLRLEQRWLVRGYENRFRYRLMASIPLNSEGFEKGTFGIHFSDELFINLAQDAFDRNRFYGAIGYHIGNTQQIQAGFLRQSLPNQYWDYLQVALFITK
jgi:hypothetical protein